MHFSLFHLPTVFPQFHASEAQFYQDMLLKTDDRAEALSFHAVMIDYDDYLYPHYLIFGDPDQWVERIQRIQTVSVTNVGLLANFGGLEHAKVVASLDRFARYVIPRVR